MVVAVNTQGRTASWRTPPTRGPKIEGKCCACCLQYKRDMTTTPRGSRGMKRSCPFDSAELPRPRPSFIPPTPFDDFVDGSSQWLHTTHARNGSNGIQGVLNTASLVSDPLTSDLPLPEACLPRSVCFGAVRLQHPSGCISIQKNDFSLDM